MAATEASGTVEDTRRLLLDELRTSDRFVLVTHEHPDGDALGSLVAMHRVLRALGKDSVMLMDADEFPLPYEYRFFDLDGLQSVPPQDLDERTVIFLDCGNIDRNPLEVVKRAGDAHHQHRPPPRQHPLRHDRPRRRRRLVHRGDRVGPHARPRRRADARGGRGALRRPRDRHRQVHVREHRRARAPHGGRAHRGRRRRARHLPAPVRGHALREARAARPRAGEPAARRRRRADVLAPVARRLPPGRGRGELHRGHHRPPALRGGDEGRRAGARAGQRGGQRPQEGLAARHRRQRRRLRSSRAPPAAAGTARRPASRRALGDDELLAFLREQVAAQL